MNFQPWGEAIRDYAKWIGKQSLDAGKEWSRRLNDEKNESSQEGALGEACTWAYLSSRVSEVNVCKSDGKRNPDFRCKAYNGQQFVVETTCMTRESVQKYTGLKDELDPSAGAQFYSLLSTGIIAKAKSKADQVADLDVPALVFVTTFHFQASAICVGSDHIGRLLTGTPLITSQFNSDRGEAVGDLYQTTKQTDSLFTAISKNPLIGSCPLVSLRRSISGLVVVGFGLRPPDCSVVGLLHPDPVRPFDVACLPLERFGRLEEWPPTDRLSVVWARADGSACDDDAELTQHKKDAEIRLRKQGWGEWLDELEDEAKRRAR